MSITGLGINNTQNSRAVKSTSSAQQSVPTQEDSAGALDALKQEVNQKLAGMKMYSGTSLSIQVTDKAYERMASDPTFKAEMMDIIQRDMAGCQSPITSLMITIDETGYSGQSYNFGYGQDHFESHSEKSAYTRIATTSDKSEDRRNQNRIIEEKRQEARLLEERHNAQALLERRLNKGI